MKKIEKLEKIDYNVESKHLEIFEHIAENRNKINEIISIVNEMKETSNILFTLGQQK